MKHLNCCSCRDAQRPDLKLGPYLSAVQHIPKCHSCPSTATLSCPSTATGRSQGSCCSGCVCTCNPWQAQLYTCPRHCCPTPCATVQPATIINPHPQQQHPGGCTLEGAGPAHATADCATPVDAPRHTLSPHCAAACLRASAILWMGAGPSPASTPPYKSGLNQAGPEAAGRGVVAMQAGAGQGPRHCTCCLVCSNAG